ncbi:uncharacterized protein EDB91DRAFT_1225584 [Suillus paluster]|uniref:uncharacterized protein n=1 Tax=Suillus paluster TaxID=48578 RepID=UPI001B8828FD|nr:uncharacterized protein EDB91DRAFT_1225584 [Suillus paluster]KAG1734707.1 hypothetical protein EDB91DRAFT_1225584 [Suillus paluster]
MVSPPSSHRNLQECEMTRNQRGLVETCFEEGQYESGIAVLEQLRSENFKPPVSLIRQLFYIALYPPPPSLHCGEERDLDPASPSKGSPTKQKHQAPKMTFAPSVSASEAAQRLLLSFVRTNTPASLFQALPQPRINGRSSELPFDGGDHDSVVAKESLCIKDAKNCWAILKEGFVSRIKNSPPSLLAGKRKRGKHIIDTEECVEENRGNSILAPVAEHAWLVLRWLVELFQRDESLSSGDVLAKHSPLLLLQIPPPRSGTGSRWEADAPLDIVFYCLSQSQPQQRQLGLDLMTLLIGVCLTAEFDFQMFLEQVTSRLYSASPEIVQTFMSGLHLSHSAQLFKLALCRKFLSDESGGKNTSTRRPKPQARAVRAARGIAPVREENLSSSSANDSSASFSASKISMPPTGDVVHLLTGTKGRSSSPAILIVKKELLISYAYLQQIAEQRDVEWQQLATGGRLEDLVNSVFGGESYAQQDRDALISLVRVWAMN